MMFSMKLVFILGALVLAVHAQDDSASGTATDTEVVTESGTDTSTSAEATSTGDVNSCITDCSAAAAKKNGCAAITDFTCVCGSAQFQADAGSCIQSICPDQLASALGLQQQACNAIGITATGLATSGTFTQTDLSLVSSGTAAASVSSESGSGSGTSSGSKTGSSSGTTSKATSTTPTSSSAGATSSAPNSASAKVVFGYGGVVAFGVAVVGMVVGGGVLAL